MKNMNELLMKWLMEHCGKKRFYKVMVDGEFICKNTPDDIIRWFGVYLNSLDIGKFNFCINENTGETYLDIFTWEYLYEEIRKECE